MYFTDDLYTVHNLEKINFETWKKELFDKSYFYQIIPFIELENIQDLDKILDRVKNYKNYFIVLDYCLEGYARECFSLVYNFVEKNNLERRVIFTSSLYTLDREYDLWISEFNKKKIFFCHYFNPWINSCKQEALHRTDINFSYEKEKWYCCLNHRPHPHRLATVVYLDYLQLLKQGIVTAHDKKYEDEITVNTLTMTENLKMHNHYWHRQYSSIIDKQATLTEPLLPLIYDIFDLKTACRPEDYNKEIYENCLINLVTETFYLPVWNKTGHLFISEKTFKPIVAKQMFLIVGPKGTISFLKNLGFKTFNEFVDESYDQLPDNIRAFKAVGELKKLTKKYDLVDLEKKTRYIRDYNHDHLKSLKIESNIWKSHV